MEEETYIEERVGKRNPFRVPENYFDEFVAKTIQQLPERGTMRRKSVWLRPWLYAAACVCVLMISAAIWLAQPEAEVQQAPVALADQLESDAFDEAADYMMLDNYDIYAYMSEN